MNEPSKSMQLGNRGKAPSPVNIVTASPYPDFSLLSGRLDTTIKRRFLYLLTDSVATGPGIGGRVG